MKLPWTVHRNRTTSPYLIDGRLPDVLAAIQVMGAAKRPEAGVAKLAADLDAKEDAPTVDKWTSVFSDHPEFFLVYALKGETKTALRWRYAYKRYDAETGNEYSEAQYSALDPQNPVHAAIRDRLTSRPLTADQIQTLMNTAIGLRTTALEEHKASVWWVPLCAALLAFLGTIVGTWLTAFLSVKK